MIHPNTAGPRKQTKDGKIKRGKRSVGEFATAAHMNLIKDMIAGERMLGRKEFGPLRPV